MLVSTSQCLSVRLNDCMYVSVPVCICLSACLYVSGHLRACQYVSVPVCNVNLSACLYVSVPV
jgi:hypothetical protein